MLLLTALILIIIWFIGIVTSFTFGGMIHLIPVLALVFIVISLDGGKRICG